MHSGHFIFLCRKALAGCRDEVLWYGEGGEKCCCVRGTVSLTTSHPPDRKSAALLLKIGDIYIYFFSSLSTQSGRTKRQSVFEQEKVLGKVLL